MTPLSSWTAVMKYAVGRSTTMPSICPLFERLHRLVVGVVRRRLLGGLDLVGDRGVAGGADLRAELRVLQLGHEVAPSIGLPAVETTTWRTS